MNLTTTYYDAGCTAHYLEDVNDINKQGTINTTPKPDKAVTLTVNLNGDRKIFTLPTNIDTTDMPFESTTADNETTNSKGLEDFDYYNTTDRYDYNSTNEIFDVDVDLFGESLYSNESVSLIVLSKT